jgi:hypothetical protein
MRPGCGGGLGLHVHRHQDRLAIHHAGALRDVESELALSEKESIGLMLYREPKKMVKRVEVLHGKLPLDGRYGVLQERCARCGVHNVINIKQQVYRIGAAVKDEQGGVGLDLDKSQSEEVRGEQVVPTPGCLLQPIERLVEGHTRSSYMGLTNPIGWLQ